MSIKLNVRRTVEVEAKYVTVYVKACDQGHYTLLDEGGNIIGERSDDYVPNKVIPGDYGDYIDLRIDLETGQIDNWKVPTGKDLRDAFRLDASEDE